MVNVMIAQPTVGQESALRRFIDVRSAMPAKKDHNSPLEKISVEAESIYSSDGKACYLREGDRLSFAITHKDSMGIALGGTSSGKVPFPPPNLDDPTTGEGNNSSVMIHAALDGRIASVENARTAAHFCFSGTNT